MCRGLVTPIESLRNAALMDDGLVDEPPTGEWGLSGVVETIEMNRPIGCTLAECVASAL